ncbi:MAG TPA: hypothetical protein VH208_11510, partial [Myxococcaceae bacterium]|nr:hypothetical protein [Myxococcaceae bacterium]
MPTVKPLSAADRIASLRKVQPEANKEPEKAGGEWERSDKGAVLKGNFGAAQRRLDATLFEDIRGAAKLREKANLASVIPTIESAAIDGLNERVGMNVPKQHFQVIADYLMARKGHAIIGAQTKKIPLTSVFLQGPDGAGQREYAGHLAELFRERGFLEGNEHGEIFEMTSSAIASKGAESAGKALQGAIGAVLHITELDGFKEAGANGKAALQTLRNFAADNEDKISIVYSGTKDEVEALPGVDHRFNPKIGYTVPFEHLNDLEIGEEAVQHAESRGYKMGRKAVAAVVENLSRERETGNFANKTRVASMVDQAILQRGAEATDRGRDDKEVTPEGFVTLTPKDFPLREAPKETALERIKRKYVGNAPMKAKLEEIAKTVEVVKKANPDTPWEQLRPQIMNLVDPVFVLIGP